MNTLRYLYYNTLPLIKTHSTPFMIILVVTASFFLHLFFPIRQLFVTPDSALSDILNFNYPLKSYLSDSLKNNNLPLWSSMLGNGFPVLGEAEVGAFSLINLILFRFFPTDIAFNLGYVVTFLLFGYGMYALCYNLFASRSVALFCALIWEFSGFHAAQIPHWNHLQTLAFFPFIFLIIYRYIFLESRKEILLLPLLISQQIFCGHYQYVFMTWTAIFVYISFRCGIENQWFRILSKRNYMILLMIFLGLGISSIQLLPSFEFFSQSTRNSLLELNGSRAGSMSISHLLQYIHPYILGDIRNGTYDYFRYPIGYWETIGYIGFIPFVLAISSILFLKKKKDIYILFGTIAILILFALEDNSPINFIFSFAPFSMFRIHSRFIEFASFFLVIAMGHSFVMVQKKCKTHSIKGLTLVVFLFFSIDVFIFSYTYNPSLPVSDILTKPKSFDYLNDQNNSVYVYSPDVVWFSYFQQYGWKYPYDYLYLQNGVIPNYTSLFNIKNISIYSGFELTKMARNTNIISTSIEVLNDEKVATISSSTIHILKLQGVSRIVSPYRILGNDVSQLSTVSPPHSRLPKFLVYTVKNSKPNFYFASQPQLIPYYYQFNQMVQTNKVLNADAYLSTNLFDSTATGSGTIEIISSSPTRHILQTNTNNPSYLVTQIYSYPGWNVTIDGKNNPIITANLIGSAVKVPSGIHTIKFEYIPRSLYAGAALTGIISLLYFILVIRSVYPRQKIVLKH